ncbi:MAG: N-6 DNA methylase, partial [Armatimonadetes bacterium]|nr:N-6 DNA methylase [Armatimonadota bacterium]
MRGETIDNITKGVRHVHPLETLATTYLTEIRQQRALSNSTEEMSYRDYLGKFLRGVAQVLGKPTQFTGEAKKITFGRPDYEVTDGIRVIGYVEAEALQASLRNLKGSAKHQNDRFRDNLHNFLLTNHLEFRLFVAGEEVAVAKLPTPSETGKIAVSEAVLAEMTSLFERFLSETTPVARTSEDIAKQLAQAAEEMLSHSDSLLHPYLNLYRQTLFDSIETDKFADVYAQTFTYGLFLAWLNFTGMIFDRDTALHAIPKAVPAIQTLMQFSELGALPEEFNWVVDGICSDLEASDKESATKHGAGISDPLIHFYETFLAAYDPQLRKQAGVYYTPDPVVDFIVRAVDAILRRDFSKPEGLANTSVQILDPATGTATFLARAYRQVHQTLVENGDAGLWQDRARDHVAKRFYAFERLPAAYTLAHINLRQQLADLGVHLPKNVRLPVYLADTMMNKTPEQINLPGADVLSREIREASKIRDQEKILVVLGNPPYSGKSDNPNKDTKGQLTFIGRLVQNYYCVDGQPLGERNPKCIQNDYVKFIRFAQWKIEQSGQGVVAFITDNSYLDSPTCRGMRWSLMQTFDEIHLLDLHGNSNKRETTPEGGKDENIFDITQGVVIAIFIRKGERKPESPPAKVYHAEFYGSRQSKYNSLKATSLNPTTWNEIQPQAPFYPFFPTEEEAGAKEEYQSWQAINDIFPLNGWGIATRKDYLLV